MVRGGRGNGSVRVVSKHTCVQLHLHKQQACALSALTNAALSPRPLLIQMQLNAGAHLPFLWAGVGGQSPVVGHSLGLETPVLIISCTAEMYFYTAFTIPSIRFSFCLLQRQKRYGLFLWPQRMGS